MIRAGWAQPRDGQCICKNARVTARSKQHPGAEWFTSPRQVNQRRYEALRAYFTEGLTYAEAGERFGYTRWAMINLVREHRAGKLQLFAGREQARPATWRRAGQGPGPRPGDRAAAAGPAPPTRSPRGWPPRAPR